MIGLLQRVLSAEVTVGGHAMGRIDAGLMVLVGVENDDTSTDAEKLCERLLTYRVFDDESGRMNRSLREIGGGLLLVPQFTLLADTRAGTRPSFSPAAPQEKGRMLFEALVALASERHAPVANGVFGAHMQVSLINDGPATFWLGTRR